MLIAGRGVPWPTAQSEAAACHTTSSSTAASVAPKRSRKLRPADGAQQPERPQCDPQHDHRQSVADSWPPTRSETAAGRPNSAVMPPSSHARMESRKISQQPVAASHCANPAADDSSASSAFVASFCSRRANRWPASRLPLSTICACRRFPESPTNASVQATISNMTSRPETIDLPQQQRPEAAGGRGQIDRQHGPRLAQPQFDQPVREVALVAHERAAAAPQPDQHHGGRIVKRHRQHAQRRQAPRTSAAPAGERAPSAWPSPADSRPDSCPRRP